MDPESASSVPDRFEMPDLSNLSARNILNLALDRILGNDLASRVEHPVGGMWTNLVRLTDKSIREYERARVSLQEWLEQRHQGHFSPYFFGIDHLENSINATHRAILIGKRLHAMGHGQDAELPETRILNRLEKFRNFIEHTEEKLYQKKAIPDRTPYILVPLEEGIRFGTADLFYEELANSIRSAYDLVEAIRGMSSTKE